MGPNQRFKINFSYFWKGFSIDSLLEMFPFLAVDYELAVTNDPEIIFYSCFDSKNPVAQLPGGAYCWEMPKIEQSNAVTVFLTGENVEPNMENCDFAITHSALVDHPNHLQMPMWAYPGYSPELLIQHKPIDWECIADQKDRFCNFVYSHDVEFRNDIFRQFDQFKRVDAAGQCMNNMGGWRVKKGYDQKLAFLQRYKFTLAIENTIWPGYQTEKLMHPMLVHSIPIYVGDPLAGTMFNPSSYVDFAEFRTIREMREYVTDMDNDRNMYLEALSSQRLRGNVLPQSIRASAVQLFMQRIFSTATERRCRSG